MTLKYSFSFFLFFSVSLISCGQETKTQNNSTKESYSFDSDSLIYHIQKLSSDEFEGRRTATEGAKKANEYIITQFKAHHILPLTDNYKQSFTFDARGKSFQGVNILGFIKGVNQPEEYIVISAHYDHEGIKNNTIYNGADDNASGVSALLAFAEFFSKNKPNHSIILAAFDAEELGLEGAKYFVNNSIIPLERIRLNINMDMISRNDKHQLYVTGTVYNDTLKSIIADVSTTTSLELLMGHDGLDGLQDWTYSGDHGAFHQKKIPFLYFGVEDHQDYHKPTDDFEKINPKFYKSSVQTIINVFSLIDKSNIK